MADGKRFSVVLTYYRQKREDGTLTDSTRVQVLADSLAEARITAESILGDARDGRKCYVGAIIELAAHLRQ